MQPTVEAVEDEDEERFDALKGRLGYDWRKEEKIRFWEVGGKNQEMECWEGDRGQGGFRGTEAGGRKRRILIAGERDTHPARDGMHSEEFASCLSQANLTGCQPSHFTERADTDQFPRLHDPSGEEGNNQRRTMASAKTKSVPGSPPAQF